MPGIRIPSDDASIGEIRRFAVRFDPHDAAGGTNNLVGFQDDESIEWTIDALPDTIVGLRISLYIAFVEPGYWRLRDDVNEELVRLIVRKLRQVAGAEVEDVGTLIPDLLEQSHPLDDRRPAAPDSDSDDIDPDAATESYASFMEDLGEDLADARTLTDATESRAEQIEILGDMALAVELLCFETRMAPDFSVKGALYDPAMILYRTLEEGWGHDLYQGDGDDDESLATSIVRVQLLIAQHAYRSDLNKRASEAVALHLAQPLGYPAVMRQLGPIVCSLARAAKYATRQASAATIDDRWESLIALSQAGYKFE